MAKKTPPKEPPTKAGATKPKPAETAIDADLICGPPTLTTQAMITAATLRSPSTKTVRNSLVYRSPSKTIPALTNPTSNQTTGRINRFSKHRKIYTTAIKGGEIMLAMLKGKDNEAGFFKPLLDYIQNPNNSKLVSGGMRINDMFWMCLPDKPMEYKEDPPNNPSSTFRPRYNVLLSYLDQDQLHKNTPQNREKWAQQIMTVNNTQSMQVYGYGQYRKSGATEANKLDYGGDLCPKDPKNYPPLSQYLTLSDTMKVVCKLHIHQETNEFLTPPEVLDRQDLLDKFFIKSHQSLLPNLFAAELEAFKAGDNIEDHIGHEATLTNLDF